MMRKYTPAIFFLIPLIFSCAGRANTAFVPVPDLEYFKQEHKIFDISTITETRDGTFYLPDWLIVFFNSGIEEVEKLDSYYGKYVFIVSNEGANFGALNIWASSFSEVKDFSMLAGRRIERRMISTSSLYPDDEYGIFFETMIKKAYSAEYPGVTKEDTYWIKYTDNSENNFGNEIYVFFILFTANIMTTQSFITGMISETINDVSPTGSQRTIINRLRQNFFWGF